MNTFKRVVVLCALVALVPTLSFAQEITTEVGLSAANSNSVSEAILAEAKETAATSQAQQPLVIERSRRSDSKYKTLYRASQVEVVSGLVIDMGTTAYNISHPMRAVYTDCMFVECHQVESSVDFHEAGFVRKLGIAGNNIAGTIALNTAYDLGYLAVADRIYRMGGKWRTAAIVMNFAQGTSRIMLFGANNMAKRAEAERNLVPSWAINVNILH